MIPSFDRLFAAPCVAVKRDADGFPFRCLLRLGHPGPHETDLGNGLEEFERDEWDDRGRPRS